jgi:hypothetical protein
LPFENIHAQIGYELHFLLNILAGKDLLGSNLRVHLQNSSADIQHTLRKFFIVERFDVGEDLEHSTIEIPAIRSKDMMYELQKEIDTLRT